MKATAKCRSANYVASWGDLQAGAKQLPLGARELLEGTVRAAEISGSEHSFVRAGIVRESDTCFAAVPAWRLAGSIAHTSGAIPLLEFVGHRLFASLGTDVRYKEFSQPWGLRRTWAALRLVLRSAQALSHLALVVRRQ